MTELETLKRAKMYIDSLARGVDPISGQPAEDDSVINNVRISRCLFYVSDVLEKVINNGGNVAAKKTSVAYMPFCITDEQMQMVYISQEPVGITEFVRRIGTVLDKGVKNTSAVHICAWLCENGYLREETVNNKTRRVVTPKGEGLGIYTVDSTGRYGVPYKKNVYTAEAQSFILSNVLEIEESFLK
ncbi:MAG: hypothetical protein E7544_08285 [Ruminococcaceae bacterium]|nr:hypothetical protein [Oscillospiraceae bacterium]